MNKISALICLLYFCTLSMSIAQKSEKEVQTIDTSSNSEVYVVVDEMPRFNNDVGSTKLFEYFQSATDKELSLKEKKNRSFVIRIIIDVDGSIAKYEILNGPDGELKKEVMKMIDGMPQWRPGRHKGIAVKVSKMIAINFKKT